MWGPCRAEEGRLCAGPCACSSQCQRLLAPACPPLADPEKVKLSRQEEQLDILSGILAASAEEAVEEGDDLRDDVGAAARKCAAAWAWGLGRGAACALVPVSKPLCRAPLTFCCSR